MTDQTTQKSIPIPYLKSQQETYCCFNPFCPQPMDRYLKSTYSSHPQCLKWIINTNEIQNKQTHGVVTIQSSNSKWEMVDVFMKEGDGDDDMPIQVLVEDEPLFTILRSSQLKQKINYKISQYMGKLKQQLIKKLASAQYYLRQVKVQSYFGKMIKIQQQIRKLLEGSNNTQRKRPQFSKIIEVVGNIQASTLLRSVDMTYLSKIPQLQSRLLKQITEIPKYLFCTKQSLRSDISLNNQQSKNLAKYLRDKSEDHNRKMAKIANLFKCDQKCIYEKKNPDLVVKCQICPMTFSTQKRKQLMNIWDNLSQHLLSAHLGEIGYNYEHLISGRQARLITVDEIIYKMTKYKYEGLELIYKGGRKIYDFSYLNRKKLSIDILLKGESTLSLRHIYITQPYEFLVIVTTVACYIQKTCEIAKPITIFTSNNAEIPPMRRLLEMLNLKIVTIVTERRTEEDLIIYQEEQEEQDTGMQDTRECQQERRIDNSYDL